MVYFNVHCRLSLNLHCKESTSYQIYIVDCQFLDVPSRNFYLHPCSNYLILLAILEYHSNFVKTFKHRDGLLVLVLSCQRVLIYYGFGF